MHDFTSLVVHLHLLLGIVVRSHLVYLRNDIVCQLMWELVDMVCLASLDDVLILLLKLSHGCSTSTRSTLVRRNMNLLDMAQVVDRLQYHYHHDGGAVWIGDDVAWTVERILGVYLWYYQWHIVAHTESA